MKSLQKKSLQRQSRLVSTYTSSATTFSRDQHSTFTDTAATLKDFSDVFLSLDLSNRNATATKSYNESFDSTSDDDSELEDRPIAKAKPRLAIEAPPASLSSPPSKRVEQVRQWAIESHRPRFWTCQVCGAVSRQDREMGPDDVKRLACIRRSVTLVALNFGRKRQCGFCCVLYEGILAFYRRNENSEKLPMAVTVDCWPGQHCKVRVEGVSARGRINVSMYSTRVDLPHLPYIPKGCQTVLDLRPATILNTLNIWLADSKARFEISPPFLPSRVLDVGTAGQAIRLVETCEDRGCYIALSHCWGKKQLITTTHSTLQERMSRIPLKSLPRTFYEAVGITRHLGIRYLWIDSLCIIQDSAKDWELQSALMGAIFSNAFITIAAVAASDSSEGCLASTPFDRQTARIECSLEGGGGAELFVGKATNSEDSPGFHGDLPRQLLSMPLCTRGWTMQEHLLAPRILYFTGTDVFFESEAGLQCHCPKRHVWPINPMKTRLITSCTVSTLPNPRAWFTEWRALIENYTRRNLTKQTDILPALSGIARRHQTFHHSRYLAGLWEADLLVDLLWSRPISNIDIVEAKDAVTRPFPACAPSWSWASIKGPVDWASGNLPDGFEFEHADSAKLVRATCELGSNPWGQPLSGELKLRGKVLDVWLDVGGVSGLTGTRKCQIAPRTPWGRRRTTRGRWRWLSEQVVLDIEDFCDGDKYAIFRVGARRVPFVFAGEEGGAERGNREVDVTAAADENERGSGTRDEEDEVIVDCVVHFYLVLRRVRAPRKERWERIGLFTKTVKRGEKWDEGKEDTLTII